MAKKNRRLGLIEPTFPRYCLPATCWEEMFVLAMQLEECDQSSPTFFLSTNGLAACRQEECRWRLLSLGAISTPVGIGSCPSTFEWQQTRKLQRGTLTLCFQPGFPGQTPFWIPFSEVASLLERVVLLSLVIVGQLVVSIKMMRDSTAVATDKLFCPTVSQIGIQDFWAMRSLALLARELTLNSSSEGRIGFFVRFSSKGWSRKAFLTRRSSRE